MSEAWRTTKLRIQLFEEIEYAVDNLKNRNLQKYDSVAAFIQEACIQLLEKEGIDYKKVAKGVSA